MGISDTAADITSRFAGRNLIRTERGEHAWVFCFAGELFLHVACPWRILLNGRIALGNCDHGQRFGLPEPINGPKESERFLFDRAIQAVRIRHDTGDLTIEFSGQATLEVLNNSSGDEGWNLGDRSGFHVVAMGGGELAFWSN